MKKVDEVDAIRVVKEEKEEEKEEEVREIQTKVRVASSWKKMANSSRSRQRKCYTLIAAIVEVSGHYM